MTDDWPEPTTDTDDRTGPAADVDDDQRGPTPEPEINRTGPLSDLAAAVDDDRDATRGGDADSPDPSSTETEFDDLFDREDVTDIDSDRLWEQLTTDDESAADPEKPVPEERTIHEIEKGSYCHQCEHFSAPPAVECTREGTDILELTTRTQFRVADCPVVREDERLERR